MAQPPYHRQNLAAAIAQQARQQLGQQGVGQLSLRQIARDLGVTPAAVYRHYPDKQALLAQLHVTVAEEVQAALQEGVLVSNDANAMFHRMVQNFLAFRQDQPFAMAFYLQGALTLPQGLVTVINLVNTAHGRVTLPYQAASVWTFLIGIVTQPQGVLSRPTVLAICERLLVSPAASAENPEA
ncbi:TetR/AcrR family transcriptional regulator [Levilactobacillus senmaizukei]|nr:TetR/AcrR family transcriptional regulator [Levilactobacillus senmaizukei]